MNLAKLSPNGQITVPIEIRRLLELNEGDKILFIQKQNGEIVVRNSSLLSKTNAQNSLASIDLSEEDILQEVLNIRYGTNK